MDPRLERSIARLSEMAGSSLAEYKEAIMDEICALTDSALSYVAAMNIDEDVLTMVGWSHNAMNACSVMTKPIVYPLEETGLWGDAVRERQAVITNDYQHARKPTKKGYPAGHVELYNHMNLPIFEDGRIVLVIGMGNKNGDYTMTDAHNVEALMNEVWAYFEMALWQATW